MVEAAVLLVEAAVSADCTKIACVDGWDGETNNDVIGSADNGAKGAGGGSGAGAGGGGDDENDGGDGGGGGGDGGGGRGVAGRDVGLASEGCVF